MSTVLVSTDFSAASRHALDYACMLLNDKDVALDLLHVFPVPVNYTSDGMALASMSEAFNRAEELIQNEVQRVKGNYAGIKIEGRIVTGSFLDTLRSEARNSYPLFIIFGTVGFTDLYLGDDDPLSALRSIPVPVLFVPVSATIKPMRNIAYASNYAYVGPQTPVREIMNWTSFIGGHLQVVHTDISARGSDAKQLDGEKWLSDQLAPLNPSFHWIQQEEVIKGLSSFISESDIDCVLVVPRKYGLWESIFHKSRTKALARLNKIPIIAFQEVAR